MCLTFGIASQGNRITLVKVNAAILRSCHNNFRLLVYKLIRDG